MIEQSLAEYQYRLRMDERDEPALVLINSEDCCDMLRDSHYVAIPTKDIRTIRGLPFKASRFVESGQFIAFDSNMDIMHG